MDGVRPAIDIQIRGRFVLDSQVMPCFYYEYYLMTDVRSLVRIDLVILGCRDGFT